MPLTIAHPASAILFRWACPQYLSWSGLVIGAVCPDFDYFLTLSNRSGAGHTVGGSFYFCLPVGLVLYVLFHAIVKRPAALLLPPGEQRRVWNHAIAQQAISARSLLMASASVLVGAWTHLAWDSLSHAGGWGPRTFPVLKSTLSDIGGYEFTLFKAVQHGSTVFGSLCLVALYLWWRQATPKTEREVPRLRVGWHIAILTALVIVPTIGALVLASSRIAPADNFLAFRAWLGVLIVGTLSFGALTLLVLCGMVGLLEKQVTS